MNLLLIPMWLLSGALFPIAGASPWLRILMRINPLTYGSVTGVSKRDSTEKLGVYPHMETTRPAQSFLNQDRFQAAGATSASFPEPGGAGGLDRRKNRITVSPCRMNFRSSQAGVSSTVSRRA